MTYPFDVINVSIVLLLYDRVLYTKDFINKNDQRTGSVKNRLMQKKRKKSSV